MFQVNVNQHFKWSNFVHVWCVVYVACNVWCVVCVLWYVCVCVGAPCYPDVGNTGPDLLLCVRNGSGERVADSPLMIDFRYHLPRP